MSCQTETKQIGDRNYSVTQWPAEDAILMKFRLAKTLGAPLAALMKNDLPHGTEDDRPSDGTDGQSLARSLSILFENSTPEELLAVVRDCVIGAGCNGKRITSTSFNELFSGDNLADVYRVFIFVLQVNYANLFAGLPGGSLLAKLIPTE